MCGGYGYGLEDLQTAKTVAPAVGTRGLGTKCLVLDATCAVLTTILSSKTILLQVYIVESSLAMSLEYL